MSMSLVISQGPKWRLRFSRTYLYSVCERGKGPKIAIFVWTSYEQVAGNQPRTKIAAEFLSVHAYTAYVSVEKSLRSPFLYVLPMEKLLVISLRPKWRPKFSRTCLYSVCERGKDLKIAIFVWTSYEQVVGNQSRTKMAAEIFSYMSI